MSVPHFPIHRDQRDNFHDLAAYDLSVDLESIEKQFDKTLLQLVDYIDMLDEPALVQAVIDLNESYQDLLQQQAQAAQCDAELDEIKKRYLQISSAATPVTIDTVRDYIDGTTQIQSLQQFYDDTHQEDFKNIRISNNSNNKRKTRGSAATYGAPLSTERLLTILPYIIDDPTCVVPDDTETEETEDDIQIEGGKIELSCPITCKPFENPMISKKCGHVFDKEGIQIYFNTPDKKKCPQGACGHELTATDFKPDQVMLLRCKINKMKRPTTTENLDTL
ncbi:E3 SUMO-protein ligase MMS21 [Nakaseomyces bracarensis]|uniref:E3 SUMO-protein ligase MMS21 n=1 Tax=Nakaseomyces bracarensis TaxID=273131 RepID=A0ABR4NX37_9SACH